MNLQFNITKPLGYKSPSQIARRLTNDLAKRNFHSLINADKITWIMIYSLIIMITRVYIDTSVIGGCLDSEFAEGSILLFDEFRSGLKTAVVSDLTLRELEEAPKEVKELLNEIPGEFIEYIFLSEESLILSDKYIEQKVVSEKHMLEFQTNC